MEKWRRECGRMEKKIWKNEKKEGGRIEKRMYKNGEANAEEWKREYK